MRKGMFTVTACYLAWGVLTIYWKLLGTVNSNYILASRIVWSFAFCLLILWRMEKLKDVKKVLCDKNHKPLLLTMLAGIVVCINWGSYIFAVQTGHIVQSSLGYYINPLLVIVLSTIFFHEKLHRLEWLSLLMAAIGVAILVVASGEVPYLALMIGGSFAIYGAIKKSANIDSEVSLAIETATAFPFAFVFILVSEMNGTGAIGSLHGWQFALLPLAGVITSVPLLLFGYGVRMIPYSMVGILQYINPTMQLLIGVFLYGEVFTKTQGITFAFIWIAVIIFMKSKLSSNKVIVQP